MKVYRLPEAKQQEPTSTPSKDTAQAQASLRYRMITELRKKGVNVSETPVETAETFKTQEKQAARVSESKSSGITAKRAVPVLRGEPVYKQVQTYEMKEEGRPTVVFTDKRVADIYAEKRNAEIAANNAKKEAERQKQMRQVTAPTGTETFYTIQQKKSKAGYGSQNVAPSVMRAETGITETQELRTRGLLQNQRQVKISQAQGELAYNMTQKLQPQKQTSAQLYLIPRDSSIEKRFQGAMITEGAARAIPASQLSLVYNGESKASQVIGLPLFGGGKSDGAGVTGTWEKQTKYREVPMFPIVDKAAKGLSDVSMKGWEWTQKQQEKLSVLTQMTTIQFKDMFKIWEPKSQRQSYNLTYEQQKEYIKTHPGNKALDIPITVLTSAWAGYPAVGLQVAKAGTVIGTFPAADTQALQKEFKTAWKNEDFRKTPVTSFAYFEEGVSLKSTGKWASAFFSPESVYLIIGAGVGAAAYTNYRFYNPKTGIYRASQPPEGFEFQRQLSELKGEKSTRITNPAAKLQSQFREISPKGEIAALKESVDFWRESSAKQFKSGQYAGGSYSSQRFGKMGDLPSDISGSNIRVESINPKTPNYLGMFGEKEGFTSLKLQDINTGITRIKMSEPISGGWFSSPKLKITEELLNPKMELMSYKVSFFKQTPENLGIVSGWGNKIPSIESNVGAFSFGEFGKTVSTTGWKTISYIPPSPIVVNQFSTEPISITKSLKKQEGSQLLESEKWTDFINVKESTFTTGGQGRVKVSQESNFMIYQKSSTTASDLKLFSVQDKTFFKDSGYERFYSVKEVGSTAPKIYTGDITAPVDFTKSMEVFYNAPGKGSKSLIIPGELYPVGRITQQLTQPPRFYQEVTTTPSMAYKETYSYFNEPLKFKFGDPRELLGLSTEKGSLSMFDSKKAGYFGGLTAGKSVSMSQVPARLDYEGLSSIKVSQPESTYQGAFSFSMAPTVQITQGAGNGLFTMAGLGAVSIRQSRQQSQLMLQAPAVQNVRQATRQESVFSNIFSSDVMTKQQTRVIQSQEVKIETMLRTETLTRTAIRTATRTQTKQSSILSQSNIFAPSNVTPFGGIFSPGIGVPNPLPEPGVPIIPPLWGDSGGEMNPLPKRGRKARTKTKYKASLMAQDIGLFGKVNQKDFIGTGFGILPIPFLGSRGDKTRRKR